jgi:hypothetical protein
MEVEQLVKLTRQRFFAYRNGIIADGLRNSGDPHSIILGLQLPDIVTIASTLPKSAALASRFWLDRINRECRLIAPMLYPVADFSMPTAMSWCAEVESDEVADILCHRLLRHLDYAFDLFKALLNNPAPQVRYVAFRLLLNLLLSNKIEAGSTVSSTTNGSIKSIVEIERENASSRLLPVLDSILEELH